MNLLSPIIWLLYIELLNGWALPKLFRYWFSGEADWFILAFHVFGFLLLCGVFFVLRRLLGERIGNITAATISAVYGITNFCVLSITGQPFVFSDLKIAGTAFSVLSSQSLSKGGVLTLTCAVLCWLGYSVTVWLMTANQVYEAKQYLLTAPIDCMPCCSGNVALPSSSISTLLINTVESCWLSSFTTTS